MGHNLITGYRIPSTLLITYVADLLSILCG